MENWRNIIPIGFILPFVIVIALEFILSYGLDFYSRSLTNQIADLESKLRQREESLAGTLTNNEFYRVFSQVVNLSGLDILNNNRSLIGAINQFNKLMPKFVSIKNFTYDREAKKISISASVPNWFEYVRFHRYITNLKELKVESLSSPSADERNVVNFSAVFSLNPSFFQQ
jgi:hypothetical protein